MFRRVLIANRGEIALRILRACRELGIETVAVYAEGDEEQAAVRHADDTICIGPASPAKSYLDPVRIIAAAEVADVDAIHPGYGFLAENANFAGICRSCDLVFIGPPPEVIAALGDKVRAKEIARQAGVPTVPGSEGAVEDVEQALRMADQVGYPALLKASAGGGGRGMRIADDKDALRGAFQQATREALEAFGNGQLYLERLVKPARHVEIQVLADAYGGVIHLGERDCTLQRRHQKLLEETPSPAISGETRQAMGVAAVRLIREAGYVNAGTVEFLFDPREEEFFFMEVNARIQVEHPVTEAVTGVDLIREQIRVAAGQRLGLRQEDVRFEGAALECRINAEDPAHGFRPSPGRISRFLPPGGIGVRVDTHAFEGYVVPSHYDSLLAKVVVHRREGREAAIRAMRVALEEMVVEGIPTTLPFHLRVLRHPRFLEGSFDTNFLEELDTAREAAEGPGLGVA